MGKFLKLHQIHETFQPYFRIREENHPAVERAIQPEVIERMYTHACFEMGTFNVSISPTHGAVTMELALWDIVQRQSLIPISGFPRNLILESYNDGDSCSKA